MMKASQGPPGSGVGMPLGGAPNQGLFPYTYSTY